MDTLIPDTAHRIALRPLALGEVSGHHHSLCTIDPSIDLESAAQLYEVDAEDGSGTKTWLRITSEGIALVHQEHKSAAIPPGEYEVIIQQQNTDWGVQRVFD